MIKNRLVIETITNIAPLRLPAECVREQRKLTKFLTDVEKTVNKLIRGAQKQTELTATELAARPTNAE